MLICKKFSEITDDMQYLLSFTKEELLEQPLHLILLKAVDIAASKIAEDILREFNIRDNFSPEEIRECCLMAIYDKAKEKVNLSIEQEVL